MSEAHGSNPYIHIHQIHDYLGIKFYYPTRRGGSAYSTESDKPNLVHFYNRQNLLKLYVQLIYLSSLRSNIVDPYHDQSV